MTTRKFVGVLLFAALLSSACASAQNNSTSQGSTAAGPPDNIKVLLDFLPQGYHSAFYAGVAEGFFKTSNINATILPGAGSADGAVKIASGAADFGFIDATAALVAMSKGADIKFVAMSYYDNPGGLIYVDGQTTINSFKDVEGLRVGAAAGDAYMVALPGLMKNAGADFSKVKVITMAPANTTPALLTKQIDATPVGLMAYAGRQATADAQHLKLDHFLFAKHGFQALGFMIVASGKTVTNNPDLVQRFVSAYAKSVIWSIANADKAVGDFVNANPDKVQAVELKNFQNAIPLEKGPKGYFVIDAARLQQTVDFTNQAYSVTVKADDTYSAKFTDKLPSNLKQGKLT